MQRIVPGDGVEIAVDVGAGPGPGTAVLVHATGFCKETWRPVLDRLRGPRAITIDQRGHGRSSDAVPPFDWWDLAGDILTVLDAEPSSPPCVGVGHSSGGAALAMAEIVRPRSFDALVLVEPIVFPGPYGRSDEHPLALGALKRRRRFDSVDEVVAAFRGRDPFAAWTDAALRSYAEFGTVDDGAGARRLACDPEVESEYYRTATAHGAWERLGEIGCPVTLVVGELSDSHPRGFAETLAARFARADLVVVPGATHFVPMERPEAVAATIQRAMEEAQGRRRTGST